MALCIHKSSDIFSSPDTHTFSATIYQSNSTKTEISFPTYFVLCLALPSLLPPPLSDSQVVRLLEHFGVYGALGDTFVGYASAHSALCAARGWGPTHIRTVLSAYSSKKPIKPIVRVTRSLDAAGSVGGGGGAHRRRISDNGGGGERHTHGSLGGIGGGSSLVDATPALYYITRRNYDRLEAEIRVRALGRIDVEVLQGQNVAPNHEPHLVKHNQISSSAGSSKEASLPYFVFPLVLFQNDAPQGPTLYRRFNEFFAFREALVAAFPNLPIPNVPEKKLFGMRSFQDFFESVAACANYIHHAFCFSRFSTPFLFLNSISTGNTQLPFLERRRVRLEAFLSHLLDHDQLCRAPLLQSFLAHHGSGGGGGGSASAATAAASTSTTGTGTGTGAGTTTATVAGKLRTAGSAGARAEEASVAGAGSGGSGGEATTDNAADMWAVEPVRSLPAFVFFSTACLGVFSACRALWAFSPIQSVLPQSFTWSALSRIPCHSIQRFAHSVV